MNAAGSPLSGAAGEAEKADEMAEGADIKA